MCVYSSMSFSYDKSFVIYCIERMETFQRMSDMTYQDLFLVTDSLSFSSLTAAIKGEIFTTVVKFGKTSMKFFFPYSLQVRFNQSFGLASDYPCQILFHHHSWSWALEDTWTL